MSPGVPDKLVAIPEGFVAIFTRVPLVVALVNSQMLRQMFTLCKTFLANIAAVRSNAVLAGLRAHDDRLSRVQ